MNEELDRELAKTLRALRKVGKWFLYFLAFAFVVSFIQAYFACMNS